MLINTKKLNHSYEKYTYQKKFKSYCFHFSMWICSIPSKKYVLLSDDLRSL